MPIAPLLPDRHPNQDFFIADIFDSLPVKGDQHTMEHPFFTLSTKPDFREVEYRRNGVMITLTPHAKLGLPTMMDKDILLYVGSLIMAEINKGNPRPPKVLRFSSHDLMVTTNRPTDGHAYRLLRNAFERLTGCLIATDIKTNDIEETNLFHILEKVRVIRSSRDGQRMVQVEVTVSDWFYNALVGKEVLTINREYFRLRKTLERRLYELARKHCGRQPEWSIGLANLKEKCGALSPINYFRHQIRQIITTDHLPDYQIKLEEGDKVIFTNRQAAAQPQLLLGLEDVPRLKRETLERAVKIVEEANAGWDPYALYEQFTEQIVSGKFKPEKSVDGAYINFVKMKVQERA